MSRGSGAPAAAPLAQDRRAPRDPRLRGVVERLWVAPGRGLGPVERVLPTGRAHLVWRVGAAAGPADAHRWAEGVLGGPRSTGYARGTADGLTIGVVLCPGALGRLVAGPAEALAEAHHGLSALWGQAGAGRAAAQLEERPDLDVLEAILVERLRDWAPPEGLSLAVEALSAGQSVAVAAARAGRTPRRLHSWFAEAVGLSPSRWAAVQRVQRALRLAEGEPDGARLALLAGFADQPHLCRDMQAVCGMTLTAWRRGRRPDAPMHVALPIDPRPGAGRG